MPSVGVYSNGCVFVLGIQANAAALAEPKLSEWVDTGIDIEDTFRE